MQGPQLQIWILGRGTGQAYPGAAHPSVTDIAFFFNADRFKVFIESVATLLLLDVFCPRGMWGLSALTMGRTRIPCICRPSPKRWATREVLGDAGLVKLG